MIKFLVGLALVFALAWLVFGALIWVINLPFLIGVIAIWLVVGMFAGGKRG